MEQIVRVVCATRTSKSDFLKYTNTGKSISLLINTSPVEVKLFDDNKQGLAKCYNMALDEARHLDRILVFLHDDLWITDFYWTERVISGLKLFDIVGVAGNVSRKPYQTSWAFLDKNYTLDNLTNLSGCVAHGNKFPPNFLSPYGPFYKNCKLLDGVFLAVKTETLNQSNLRFDDLFMFHFYDMDFCRTAESRGLKMGTIPLSLIHKSPGTFNSPDWQNSYEAYLSKWGS